MRTDEEQSHRTKRRGPKIRAGRTFAQGTDAHLIFACEVAREMPLQIACNEIVPNGAWVQSWGISREVAIDRAGSTGGADSAGAEHT